MDGDDLTDSEPSEPSTLAEIFTNVFPYYLSMGMTYEEFWHGAPSLVRAYRKAYDMKRHERNQEMWMQGKYFFDALRCAPLLIGFPEKGYKPSGDGYPDKPYPLTEKEAREQEIERENENTKRFIAQLEAESKRNKEAKKEAVKDGREHD